MFRSVLAFVSLVFFTLQLVASEINEDYEKAIKAFNSEQFDASYIHLKNSLDNEPNHLPSKVLMGKVLALSLYYSEAIIEFEEALLAGADPNLIIEFYVNSLVVQREFDKILSLSKERLSVRNIALLNSFKANAVQALDKPGADEYFDSALKGWPNNPSILNAYARYLISNNQLSAAQAQLDKALSIDAAHSETLRTQALLYKLSDNKQLYIETLEKTIEIDSEQPFVLRDLITAYLSENDVKKSRELLEKLLANNKQDFMASLLLSYIDSLSGETDSSSKRLQVLVNDLSLIDNAIIDKASGLLYVNGLANFALGNNEKAKTELAKYLTYQPNNLKAAKILADLYARTGNTNAALSTLLAFSERLKSDIDLISRVCALYFESKSHIKCNRLLRGIDPALQQAPLILSLRAQSLSAQGKDREALTLLQNITQTSNTTQITKALLAIQTGQLQLAETTSNQLLEQSPTNSDYLNLKAGILIKQGRFAEAENLLKKLLNTSPQHYEARFNLASVYFNQGKLEQAKQLAQVLQQEKELQVNVLYLLGAIAHSAQEFELSINQLEIALQQQADFRQARILQIENYQALNQFSKALSEVNVLLRENFLDEELLKLRATIYYQLSEFENVVKDLNTLFSIHQDSPEDLYTLAALQWRLNEKEAAFKSVSSALKLKPTDFYLLRLHAQYSLALDKLSEATSSISVLSELFEDNPDVALLRGDLALLQNDAVKASRYYDTAIKINKYFEQALYKRYNLAMRGIEETHFVSSFEKLASQSDTTTSVNHYLADYYLSRGATTKAKSYYSLALRDTRYFKRASILNNLSYVYQLEKDFEQSVTYARNALALEPNNSATLDTLGWSLVNMGEVQEGLDLLRQSYSLNTSNPNTMYHIAFALKELDRKKEAKQTLEGALAKSESFKNRESALNLLDLLNDQS
ncbi:XrtA/PEP-CTERM system TPR-repeat protein PrsT [Glaciecola sp. KUL10]|uniref:XrtA/PEP-CTERM system TPR-repeat protein PrsT n=1 Tax=Glaciecola sp. (strain KUL10) TaxID=2161813 RepID=UPI000D78B551|nr:XrtA/PEP-CTERM system TPR-repeat protein PrsT [Glaciecola sp. KUL10]GBL04635.1 hypothetical protein KUL10_19440 [Glaciecola sp. KUL10]